MRGLRLWEFLEVPELRYNRVEIFLGIKWRVPGAGIILSCTPDTDSEGNQLTTGTCTLKLEEGEFGAVSKDDIALGIFHLAMKGMLPRILTTAKVTSNFPDSLLRIFE